MRSESSDPRASEAALVASVDGARALVQQGRLDAAERAYLALVDAAPASAEALNFVGLRALQRGESRAAAEWLKRAAAADRSDPSILRNLGLAYIAGGVLDPARYVLRQALDLAPDFFAARLSLGSVLEQQGRESEALTTYFRAILDAQAQGRWLSDEATAPALREPVRHAMAFVAAGRRRRCDETLAPLRERYGACDWRRIDACVAGFLGEQPIRYDHALQKPKFLYVPGLNAQPSHARAAFAWLERVEHEAAAICAEWTATVAAENDYEALVNPAALMPLGNAAHAPSWRGYFLYRDGRRYPDHCERCPQTAALLAALPQVDIPKQAPESAFMVVAPGTRTSVRFGVTNSRLLVAMPLRADGACALLVGRKPQALQPGRCLILDDSFEHELHNAGAEPFALLTFYVWHPDLHEFEHAALADVIAASVDFNSRVRES